MTEAQRRKQYRSDLRTVMLTPEGKRLIWALLRKCNIHTTIMNESHAQMAFMAGQQNTGHELIADIEDAAPGSFLEMQKEMLAEERAANQEAKTDDDDQ